MSDLVIGGTYVHYKNKKYRVLGVARHTETLEEVVYYECLYENEAGRYWVRPKAMFCENVTVDGYSGPRFRLDGTSK